MAQAIGDPEEIQRFAAVLMGYVETLSNETSNLQGAFAALGDTWQDEKRVQFEDAFNQLVGQIGQFCETCTEQVPHLEQLAARLSDYLQS